MRSDLLALPPPVAPCCETPVGAHAAAAAPRPTVAAPLSRSRRDIVRLHSGIIGLPPLSLSPTRGSWPTVIIGGLPAKGKRPRPVDGGAPPATPQPSAPSRAAPAASGRGPPRPAWKRLTGSEPEVEEQRQQEGEPQGEPERDDHRHPAQPKDAGQRPRPEPGDQEHEPAHGQESEPGDEEQVPLTHDTSFLPRSRPSVILSSGSRTPLGSARALAPARAGRGRQLSKIRRPTMNLLS